MKKVLLIAAVGATLLFSQTGCKKYEDGPTISFVSRKDRISNTWKIESVTQNGTDYTAAYNQLFPDLRYDVNKNGSITRTVSFFGIPTLTTGSWTFQSNDEEMRVSFPNTTDAVFIILRLKQKELWLKEVSNGDTYEYHYVQA